MKQIETIVRDYIKDIIHMSIATSQDNKPWISEVHFSYDDELNLYFISRPNRRHSLEIAENKRISGNIVKQYAKGEKVRGVYYEGSAEMLDKVTEDHSAFVSYNERFNNDTSVLAEQSEENGHRWYKITVNRFYLFDELEMQPAGKHKLDWK